MALRRAINSARMISDQQRMLFQETVWNYYREHARRDLPWRLPDADGNFDAYKIMVSELMLQQTQVARVVPKFEAFLREFPDVVALAKPPLAAVLIAWNGLGYNRRAKFLWQAAQASVTDHKGRIPATVTELKALPGIGTNTAGAIMAYAYNLPAVFIETNIRTVFIHHFFADGNEPVTDAELEKLVADTLDREHPREWYWALMDYGVYVKQSVGNAARRSKSYTKQSTFQGSLRQIRGTVIRELMGGPRTKSQLAVLITDPRLDAVLADLASEKLIENHHARYHLANT